MAHVFISYARKDGRTQAEALDVALRRAGYATWRDKRDLDPTQDFTGEIEQAIREASHVVTCITPDVERTDSFVRREIQYALAKDKPLYVARMHSGATPPIHIINHTYCDFAADWQAAFQQLREFLARPVGDYTAPAPGAPAHPQRVYVQNLYDRLATYLEKAIIRLINLEVAESPEAVPPQPVDHLALMFGDAETHEPFTTFAEAFTHYNGRMLLLGEPGAGKTITLTATARQAAADWLTDPATHPLPIVATLSLWDSLKQTPLAEWLGNSDRLLTSDQVRGVMDAGKALLLLDGLDEMGSDRTMPSPLPQGLPSVAPPFPQSAADGGERGAGQESEEHYDPRKRFLSVLKAQLGQNHALVTCRITDYKDIGDLAALDGAVTLQKLTDTQLREYLKDLPTLLEAVETDDALKEISRTPLLLSFFAFAFRDREGELKALEDLREGALRDAIFNAYMEKRYAHEERRLKWIGEKPPFALQEIRDVLGRVAMENVGGLFKRGSDPDSEILHIDNVLDKWDFRLVLEARQVLSFVRFCVSINLLREHTDHSWSFIHLWLRDALAHMFALLNRYDEYFYGSIFEPNPAVVLAEIGVDSDRALLIDLINYDLDKTVRMCAIHWLARLIVDRKPLGEHRIITLENNVIDNLRTVLMDANYWDVHSDITRIFGELRSVRAIDALIEALGYIYLVYDEAITALEQIGEPAVSPLIEALTHPDPEVRAGVIITLGILVGLEALDYLTAATNDISESVRRSAAVALGRLNSSQIIRPLVQLLGDSSELVRHTAFDILRTNDLIKIDILAVYLDSDNLFVNLGVSSLLAIRRDNRAFQPLMDFLQHPDEAVRSGAANALGMLGNTQTSDKLIHLLSDSSENVQCSAALALGRLKEKRAVSALISLLDHTDDAENSKSNGVQRAIVQALQDIDTVESVDAADKWLPDQNPANLFSFSDDFYPPHNLPF